MTNKKITLELSEAGINRAIHELDTYTNWLKRKAAELLERLAADGCEIASAYFASAVYDGTNDVSVSVKQHGRHTKAVVAIGSATLFIEFGTGILYPDNHPEAAENGMVRGQYGHHLGSMPSGWRYKGVPGTNGQPDMKHPEYIHTYGNPANMPMYTTVKGLKENLERYAREVFV